MAACGQAVHAPTAQPTPPWAHNRPAAGLAVSSDGINWRRGEGRIEGARGPRRALDVGRVLEPNADWWWFDTCHLAVGDVQILSSNSVSSGEGVYWMFYSGGSFEAVPLPAGLSSQVGRPGRRAGAWRGCVAPQLLQPVNLGTAPGPAWSAHPRCSPTTPPPSFPVVVCRTRRAARAATWRACACAPAWP